MLISHWSLNMASTRCNYSTIHLFNIRKVSTKYYVTPTTMALLKTLGIWRSRGTRAGSKFKSKSNSIPVRITAKKPTLPVILNQHRSSFFGQPSRTVVPIARALNRLPVSSESRFLYSNCRSIGLLGKLNLLHSLMSKYNMSVCVRLGSVQVISF